MCSLCAIGMGMCVSTYTNRDNSKGNNSKTLSQIQTGTLCFWHIRSLIIYKDEGGEKENGSGCGLIHFIKFSSTKNATIHTSA